MDASIFMDKAHRPTDNDLLEALGNKTNLWNKIKTLVLEKVPEATQEWNFPGKKYGWSFRLKDKKRAILYLLPHDKHFMVAFVFGQKATDDILESNISMDIKEKLQSAKVYAEGRGIRIDINHQSDIDNVEKLIDFKLKY